MSTQLALTELMAAQLAEEKRSTATTSTKGTKRRRNERNILTFYEKIAVIRYYDETNISRNSLAKMFHCCATQIRRILDRKTELLQQLATLNEADASIILEEMTRKRRKFEMSAISFILHQWVERCRKLRLRNTITNQTLKETALKMAAILNLPAFRPSYRWLNRFRDKYKYIESDLGCNEELAVPGELSVEDIIIEFKDALPSFMQKEITNITASVKETGSTSKLTSVSNENSVDSVEISDVEDDDGEEAAELQTGMDNDVVEVKCLKNMQTNEQFPTNEATFNAGTCTLLNGVFPHLAVIHQFALMNSDIKALELISQLGVHMQMQATTGAYNKQLTLATTEQQQQPHQQQQQFEEEDVGIFADIDDIELIE